MAEVDRRSRAILNSLQAARDERAAAAQEERNFMTSFNPNTAGRGDFTRFRENLKEQALRAANARPDGGIMGAKNAEIFRSLYDDPYRKMMGQYLKTNPKDYQENFPYSFAIQRALPMAAKAAMGAISGIPMLGKMLPEQTNELLGDFSYLDYKPNQSFSMQLPDYFYQFIDSDEKDNNEILQYLLGMR